MKFRPKSLRRIDDPSHSNVETHRVILSNVLKIQTNKLLKSIHTKYLAKPPIKYKKLQVG